MNDYRDTRLGTRFLPGVDLVLWLRIVVLVIVAAAVAGIVLATH